MIRIENQHWGLIFVYEMLCVIRAIFDIPFLASWLVHI